MSFREAAGGDARDGGAGVDGLQAASCAFLRDGAGQITEARGISRTEKLLGFK